MAQTLPIICWGANITDSYRNMLAFDKSVSYLGSNLRVERFKFVNQHAKEVRLKLSNCGCNTFLSFISCGSIFWEGCIAPLIMVLHVVSIITGCLLNSKHRIPRFFSWLFLLFPRLSIDILFYIFLSMYSVKSENFEIHLNYGTFSKIRCFQKKFTNFHLHS